MTSLHCQAGVQLQGPTHGAPLDASLTSCTPDMPPRLLVTGFGEFAGIARNPTQEVVEWLGSLSSRSPSIPCTNGKGHLHVLSTTVLKVSATAVDDFLRQQLPLLEELARTGSDPLVLLHFGVDATRDIISLESVAANEATFRVPDQDGWQPSNTPITDVPSPCCVLLPGQPTSAATSTSSSHQQQNGYTAASAAADSTPGDVPGTATAGQAAPPGLGAGNGVLPSMGGDLGTSACCQQLTTDLPLQHMQQVLANAGYQCQVSSDAGRFICNWTYFRSLQAASILRAATGCPCYALFVHVPRDTVMPLEKQKHFAELLLEVVGECCVQASAR